MENGNNGNWNILLNKQIKVIIEDTDFPKKKEGKLISFSDTHLFIETESKIETVLLTKVLRTEVIK